LFVHAKDFEDFELPETGDRVEFEMGSGRDGRPKKARLI
jgi:cold shock CspA family protein